MGQMKTRDPVVDLKKRRIVRRCAVVVSALCTALLLWLLMHWDSLH